MTKKLVNAVDVVTQGGSSRQPRPQGLLAFQEDPGDEVVFAYFRLSLGSFSIDDGNCSENVSFKMNSRFFKL